MTQVASQGNESIQLTIQPFSGIGAIQFMTKVASEKKNELNQSKTQTKIIRFKSTHESTLSLTQV